MQPEGAAIDGAGPSTALLGYGGHETQGLC